MNYGDNNGARGERDRNKPRVVAGLRDVHKSGERIHGHWATAIDHFARNKKTRFPISTRISEIATPFLRTPSLLFYYFFFFFYLPRRLPLAAVRRVWSERAIDRRSRCLHNGNGTDPWPILTLSRSEFQEKHRKQEGAKGREGLTFWSVGSESCCNRSRERKGGCRGKRLEGYVLLHFG